MRTAQATLDPIQVYLDSSDFSILSNQKELAKSSDLQNILETLRLYIERDIIEVRFSVVHVLEIAHLDPSAKSWAVDRARTIKTLCRNNVLKPLPELYLMDVVHLVNKAKCVNLIPDFPDYAHNDSGAWYPDLTDTAQQLGTGIIESLKSILRETGLSRPQRKKLERMLVKNDRLTRLAKNYLSQNREHILKECKKLFPLIDYFWENDFLLKFAFGEMNAKTVVDELLHGVFDIENFITWYMDHYEDGQEAISWLRNQGGTHRDNIESAQRQIRELHLVGALLGKYPKEITRLVQGFHLDLDQKRRILLHNLFSTNEGWFKNCGIDLTDFEQYAITSTIGSIPSFDTDILIAKRYILNNITSQEYARNVQDSDFGDLLHTSYTPYVDIFRADKYMGSLITDIARTHGTQVVTSLMRLPDIISEEAKRRGFL